MSTADQTIGRIDVRPAPARTSPKAGPSSSKSWLTVFLRCIGSVALVGFFLALSAAAFAFAGMYGLIEFARLY